MPRYKLTVAYDGTEFHGWQKQHSTSPQSEAVGEVPDSESPPNEPLRTAQGVLEDAVRHVVREPVTVLGASRTDAGVHALGQVAAFTCWTMIEPEKMQMALNSRLPGDLQVHDVEIVNEDFNPISDCTSKGYRYSMKHGCHHSVQPPLFDRHQLYWTAYDLDPVKMHEAAQYIIGEHDFLSFTRVNHGRESTVRTVFDCSVTATDAHHCHIDISGNGFLYNMVRIIAGTLREVGRGKIEPGDVPAILEARDRSQAGPTLPPEGLCLMWVKYGGDSKNVRSREGASVGDDNGLE